MSDKKKQVVFNYKKVVFWIMYPIFMLFFFMICVVLSATISSKTKEIIGIIIGIVLFALSVILIFGILSIILKNPFEKTIFDSQGVEYKLKKTRIFLLWEEIEIVNLQKFGVSLMRKDYYVLSLSSSSTIMQIETSPWALKDLKNKFLKFCPRADLIGQMCTDL